MGWFRFVAYVLGIAAILVAMGALFYLRPQPRDVWTGPAAATPVALLGDSDNHSYQDSVSFPAGGPERGGAYRVATLQWIEVLMRLRGNVLDAGAWGVYGTPRLPAYVMKKLGILTRKPRREDYYYNFAVSGAGCEDLLDGWQESRVLAQAMDDQPERWRNGVVIVRTGINTFGRLASMDALAHDPADPETVGRIDDCVAAYRQTVALIRARHPTTRFVLVGIFDNANWVRNFDRWQSAEEIANISKGLDRFDDALRAMAAEDPNIAFFDDRAFFRTRWGGRDENGRPAYRRVSVGPLEIANSEGDPPNHLNVRDGHAGLACNVLWAQAMARLLHERFGLTVDAISDAEAAQFVQMQLDKLPPALRAGLAAD